MRHKLTTFILKNPPGNVRTLENDHYFSWKFLSEVNPAVQGSSLTEGKKSKRTNKKGDGTSNSPKQGSENGSENELDASENNVNVILSHQSFFLTNNVSLRVWIQMMTGLLTLARQLSKLEWKI